MAQQIRFHLITDEIVRQEILGERLQLWDIDKSRFQHAVTDEVSRPQTGYASMHENGQLDQTQGESAYTSPVSAVQRRGDSVFFITGYDWHRQIVGGLVR